MRFLLIVLLILLSSVYSAGETINNTDSVRKTISLNGEWKTKLSSKNMPVQNPEKETYLLDDFEGENNNWSGIVNSTENSREGKSSGKYVLKKITSVDEVPACVAIKNKIPHDWTNWGSLEFWCYCPTDSHGAEINIGATSENPDSPDWDYYYWKIKLDWTGWKKISLKISEASAMRKPAGWHKIDSLKFWITQTPRNPTYQKLVNGQLSLYLDQLTLIPAENLQEKRTFSQNEGIMNKWYSPDYDDKNWKKIKIPSPWKDELRWYRKSFSLPETCKDKRIILRFESLSYVSWIWINGELLNGYYNVDPKYSGASSQMLFTGCEFDITRYVKYDSSNSLAIMLFWPNEVSPESWREQGEVEIRALPSTYLHRVLITPDIHSSSLNIRAMVKNTGKAPVSAKVKYEISRADDGGGVQAAEALTVNIPGDSEKEISFNVKYGEEMKLWSPDSPQLYNFDLSLSENDIEIDKTLESFGFREFKTEGKRFYLNGKSFFLRGEGFIDRKDPEFLNSLKKLNINISRTIGIPALKAFYDQADSTGILIIDEAGGNPEAEWGKYDVKEYHRNYLRELPRRIYANYNHPCIVIWSMGNEQWRSPVSDLNDKYNLAKKLDPFRPILTGTGGTAFSVGGMSSSEYEDFKTDIDDVHCYHGWYEKPILFMEDWIDFVTSSYKGPERPLINTETVGRYPSFWAPYKAGSWQFQTGPWPRWIGERCLKMSSPDESKKVLQMTVRKMIEGAKVSVEMWRMRKGDTAGAFIWDSLCATKKRPHLIDYQNVIKMIFSPVFTCARFYDRNFFTGASIEFPLYVINDLQEEVRDLNVFMQIQGTDGKIFKEEKYESGNIDSDGIKSIPVSFTIGKWPADNYTINLKLMAGNKEILRNYYDFFVYSENILDKKIDTDRKLMLLDTNGKTAKILDSLNVKFARYDSIKPDTDISRFDTIIIGSCFDGDIPKGKFDSWVKNGGRLLCLDQGRPATRIKSILPSVSSFIYTFGQADDYLHGQFNSFVDVSRIEHPVFAGLTPEQFEDWNGFKHVLTDGFFEINNDNMEKYILAKVRSEGHWNGSSRPGAVILDMAFGKGEYMLSQLQAVERYGNDPVATKYLQNLFEYILLKPQSGEAYIETKSIGDGPFPLSPEGFVMESLICGPFPNPGGRPHHSREDALKNNIGFSRDCFRGNGPCAYVEKGENDIEPVPGMKHDTVFPLTKEKYWNIDKDEKLTCRWLAKEAGKGGKFMLAGNFCFSENIVAYVAFYVESPEEKEVKVKLGSDDGFKLWINHLLIGSLNTFRSVEPDTETYRIKLNKGINPVLLKITNDIGDSGFCLRFTDLSDKPLSDIKVWLVPNR